MQYETWSTRKTHEALCSRCAGSVVFQNTGKLEMISPYLERPIRTLATVLADMEYKHRAAVDDLSKAALGDREDRGVSEPHLYAAAPRS